VVSDGRTASPSTATTTATTATSTEGPVLIGAGLVDDTPTVSDLPQGAAAPAASDALAASAAAADGGGSVHIEDAASSVAEPTSNPATSAALGAAAGAAAATLVASDAPSVPETTPETTPAAPRLEVSFLVDSDPPGATVTLDGKNVGQTPVRVPLDPRTDHLLVIDRQGCESVVQLLATEAWRNGRSAQTRVRLQCQP
jgi:hypothetical protein